MSKELTIREAQLVSLIHAGLDATHRPRNDNDIHVSNLLDFCPREFAILQEFGEPYNKSKSLGLRELVTFRLGDKIHDLLQEAFKGANILEINELSFRLPIGKGIYVTGSCDNVIKFPGERLCHIVECKSIDGDKFDQLNEAPIVNHELQLSLYLWFLQQTEWKSKLDPERGFVVYLSKKYTHNPIRPFMIKRAKAFCEHVAKQLKEVKTYLKTKKVPKQICKTRLQPRARSVCSVVDYCFRKEK